MGRPLRNLAVAPFAIVVNLVASIPGAVRALIHGELDGRVPATALIALGGRDPRRSTSGANRFGATGARSISASCSAVVFLFAGFVVSAHVLGDIRVPFTRIVLRRRRGAADVPASDPP